jgi:hypothetical protein
MDRNSYQPIACDFHDDLESYAVKGRRVRIFYTPEGIPQGRFQGDAEAPLFSEGRIRDIYTTPEKEEFLRLDEGAPIRLDRILSVEGLV